MGEQTSTHTPVTYDCCTHIEGPRRKQREDAPDLPASSPGPISRVQPAVGSSPPVMAAGW
jgi:hypothetical protein